MNSLQLPRRRLLLCALLGLASALPAQAQSSVIDREVIVRFTPGTVLGSATDGAPASPETYVFSTPALLQLLLDAQVETMRQIIPGFDPEDRFATLGTGETVGLTDWTDVYVLTQRSGSTTSRAAFLALLRARPDVVYAHPNVRGEPDDIVSYAPVREEQALIEVLLTPNDTEFGRQWMHKNDGTVLQGSGTPGADMKTYLAWNRETGDSWVKVGVIDCGMQTSHTDFTGRASGDAANNCSHGTAVAGVAAAKGNNGTGIAGVAWGVGIINEDYGNGSAADFVAAVQSAYNRGANVLNNSWKLVPVGTYSVDLRQAFADAYRLGRSIAVSMGNQSGNVVQYPAAYGQGFITVGATTQFDVRASYSSTGSWIDVAAPGGATSGNGRIYTTFPTNTYDYNYGTSFSTPATSGLAALLMSYGGSLQNYPDDVEQIIRLSADDKGDPGFDNLYGTGRINADKALAFLESPWQLTRASVTGGGSVYSTSGQYDLYIYNPNDNLVDGLYRVKRREVRRTVNVGFFDGTPYIWGRGGGSGIPANQGWGQDDPPNQSVPYTYGLSFTDVVSNSSPNVTLRTYVYEVWSSDGQTYYGYYPTTAANAAFAYTILAKPCGASCNGRPSEPVAGEETPGVPAAYALQAARPNPFHAATTLTLLLPETADVRIGVYDVLGREVVRLAEGAYAAGEHEVAFDGARLPSGVYVVRVEAAGNKRAFTQTQRVTLLR